MKRDRFIEQRRNFCKLAFNNQEKAANELRDLATGLENCRTSSDIIQALELIFAVSERTITRDLCHDDNDKQKDKCTFV